MQPSSESPGWWRDDWGAWHGPPEDRGNAGPHEPTGPRLPPHLRPSVPRPFVAAFAGETPPDATPEPIEAPGGPGQLPDDDERAVRGLMAFLRSLLPHEEAP